MSLESQSPKKRYFVIGGGDVYGVMVVPKDLLLSISAAAAITKHNHHPHLLPRFPDIGRACHVSPPSSSGGHRTAGLARTMGWKRNNMLRIIPTQAIDLGTFEFVKRAMTSAQEKWNQTGCPKVQIGIVSLSFSLSWVSPVAVAGAAAGVVSTLVCHPLEVLKDRLIVNPEIYPSLSLPVWNIYNDSGIGGLYAGISGTLIGMLPYSTCYYFMYETMKKSYCLAKKKASFSRAEVLLVGALSGPTASTISYPLEVARKRLMVGALQGKCPPHVAAALSEVVGEEGLIGL